MNSLFLILGAMFIVTLQPQNGTGGGPVRVTIEAHDSNTARRLANAQYAPSYRVTNVARSIDRPSSRSAKNVNAGR